MPFSVNFDNAKVATHFRDAEGNSGQAIILRCTNLPETKGRATEDYSYPNGGKRDDPRWSAYFAYDASRYTDDHDAWVIIRLHRPELRRLGRAACGLSAVNLERLIRAAEEIRRNEGLPPTVHTAGI